MATLRHANPELIETAHRAQAFGVKKIFEGEIQDSPQKFAELGRYMLLSSLQNQNMQLSNENAPSLDETFISGLIKAGADTDKAESLTRALTNLKLARHVYGLGFMSEDSPELIVNKLSKVLNHRQLCLGAIRRYGAQLNDQAA